MNKHLTGLLVPFLVAICPIVFLYSHNVKVLNVGDLVTPLLMATGAAVGLYGLFYLFKRNELFASLSAVIFLAANFSYGFVFNWLLARNRFPVEHITLLPVVIYLAGYAVYFFNFISAGFRRGVQKILLIMILVLVGYNIAAAVPAEIQKARLTAQAAAPVVSSAPTSSKKYPDVYFLVFDEYAGFGAVREYWRSDHVDALETFLKDNQFFIASRSRSNTTATFEEMASRLNLKRYPTNTDRLTYFKEITNNKVMNLFKTYGYSTVAFPGPFPEYTADLNYTSAPGAGADSAVGSGEFRTTLIEMTMLRAFSNYFQSNTTSVQALNELNYFLDKIPNLVEAKSPRFVVAHILFPHVPFIVDKNGEVLDPKHQYNWNYYLGQHIYATGRIEELISNILANSDPDNPPVIILQSDHGARNNKLPTQDSIILEDYNFDSYAYDILLAMYLPGYDISQLPDDLNPMDTFVIVLNHYLDANVTADKTLPK